MDKHFRSPTKEAEKEAKKHPNGYVYVVDENFKDQKNVPPINIIGAWKVDEKGKIIGVFTPNPNHFSKLS